MSAADPVETLPVQTEALRFQRLDTFFLFPFALDKAAIQADHPSVWKKELNGLTDWIRGIHGRQHFENYPAVPRI